MPQHSREVHNLARKDGSLLIIKSTSQEPIHPHWIHLWVLGNYYPIHEDFQSLPYGPNSKLLTYDF